MQDDDEFARQLTAIAQRLALVDPQATAAFLIALAARFDSDAVPLHVPDGARLQ